MILQKMECCNIVAEYDFDVDGVINAEQLFD